MAEKDTRIDRTLERRATRRFAIEQDVFYKILDHKVVPPESGAGKTVDISSGGMLFQTERRVPAGRRVEVSVNWPANLEGGCPLKLVAFGRVVRSDEQRTAIHIEQHEFRTRRIKKPAVEVEQPPRPQVPYY